MSRDRTTSAAPVAHVFPGRKPANTCQNGNSSVRAENAHTGIRFSPQDWGAFQCQVNDQSSPSADAVVTMQLGDALLVQYPASHRAAVCPASRRQSMKITSAMIEATYKVQNTLPPSVIREVLEAAWSARPVDDTSSIARERLLAERYGKDYPVYSEGTQHEAAKALEERVASMSRRIDDHEEEVMQFRLWAFLAEQWMKRLEARVRALEADGLEGRGA